MFDLPPQQLECIAQAIYSEARGETEHGQRAVGHVIINRAKQRNLSPCQVIRQPGQFRILHRTQFKGTTWENIRKLAGRLGSDPTGGALYFKTHSSKVSWNFRLTGVIGNHKFYK